MVKFEVKVAHLHGTPVFVMDACSPTQKKVFGARFSKRRRVWLCPAFPPFHDRVIHDLEVLFKGKYHMSSAAEKYLERLSQVPELVQKMDINGYTPLYENYAHQTEALSRAIWYPRYGLFLGRGLGKTKIAVDLMRYLKKKDPSFMALILALRVNLFTWKNETEKFSGGEFTSLPLEAKSPAQRTKRLEAILDQDPLAVVCTYDTARVAHEELFRKVPYTMIISDESHKLRGYKSKQTAAAIRLAQKASRRLLLTGTPSLGSPMHLWGQLKFLGNFIVPGWWDYSNRYLKRAPHNRHIITGFKNQDHLNRIVGEISLAKEAHECLDLPERIFQDITVEPSGRQKQLYNRVVSRGALEAEGIKLRGLDMPIVKLGKLSQLSAGFVYLSRKDPTVCNTCPHMRSCVRNSIQPYTRRCLVDTEDPGSVTHWVDREGGPVVRAIKELCLEHLNEGKKVIVWGAHVAVIARLHRELAALKPEGEGLLEVLRYDSTTAAPHLVEAAFNNRKEARVIVAQISMGIGVTFNAPVMLYAELSTSLDHWLQSQDRNWGIRAKGHDRLIVQTVTVRGSVQAATSTLLKSKIDVADMMTKKPSCVGCPEMLRCVGDGTTPFSKKCIFSKETSKTTLGLTRLD